MERKGEGDQVLDTLKNLQEITRELCSKREEDRSKLQPKSLKGFLVMKHPDAPRRTRRTRVSKRPAQAWLHMLSARFQVTSARMVARAIRPFPSAIRAPYACSPR